MRDVMEYINRNGVCNFFVKYTVNEFMEDFGDVRPNHVCYGSQKDFMDVNYKELLRCGAGQYHIPHHPGRESLIKALE